MAQELAIAPQNSASPIFGILFLLILIIIPIILSIIFFKKNKSAFWGGVIGFIVTIIYVPFSFIDPVCPINNCFFLKKMFIGIIHLFYNQCAFFTQCSGEACFGCLLVFAPLLTYLELTLLGFLIGWMVGKIKSRNQI
jgi:hypothetical protein